MLSMDSFSAGQNVKILTNEAFQKSGCDVGCRCLFMFIVQSMSALAVSELCLLTPVSEPSLVTGLRGPDSRYEDSGVRGENQPAVPIVIWTR